MNTELQSTYATKLSNEELAALAELHKKGTPLSELARRLGKPEAMVRMALRRAAQRGLKS